MKTDGSILIDTKIIDGGMEKGFELIKDEMSSVGITAKQVGEQIELSFSKMDVSKPIANAVAKVQQLEQQLANVTSDFQTAVSEGDDKSAERLAAKRVAVYERLEAAREKLSLELAQAVQKEADAEEKATQKKIKAAEKEAAAKKRAQEKQFSDMTKPVRRFGSRLREIISGALVFNVISAALRKVTQYFGTALKSNNEFTKSFSQLKGAILTAFQPIYEAIVPAIITLVNWLNVAVQVVARFFAALSGKSYGQIQNNAKALYEQSKALGAVGGAAKEAAKQLAGFDEINRLESNEQGGGGGGGSGNIGISMGEPNVFDNLTPQIETIVNRIQELLLPLQEIDFTPIYTSVMRLGESLSYYASIAYDSLEWVWFNILVPLSQWTIEELGPASVNALTEGFELLNAVIEPLKDGMQNLLKKLQPVFSWIGDVAIFIIDKFGEYFNQLADVFREKGPEISGIISGLGDIVLIVWNTIQPVLSAVISFVGNVMDTIFTLISDVISSVIDILYGLIEFIAGVFSGDWSRAWNGILDILAGIWNAITGVIEFVWNGIVDILKGIIDTIFGAVTGIINFISGLFGNETTFQSTVTIPSASSYSAAPTVYSAYPDVPMLAKGAVIPPNKKFLAVLGDQKHGTNIEAPLSTIQDAVRMEIGSQLQTTNDLLQRILEKDTDVILDGDKVGESVARYQRNLARARGY